MEKVYQFRILLFVVILFVNVNCKKDDPFSNTRNIVIPPAPPPPPNRAPEAYAGLDFSVGLFSNDMTLIGKVTDPDMGNTLSSSWTKISGPACSIASPQSPSTQVSNLVEGEYQFELLVSDNYGATDRDTVIVKAVRVISLANQVNFSNLSWNCPFGCTIEIDNFFSQISPNTPIRIFIQLDSQIGWYEAVPISQYSFFSTIYYYGFYGDRLSVYTESDASGKASIKVLF